MTIETTRYGRNGSWREREIKGPGENFCKILRLSRWSSVLQSGALPLGQPSSWECTVNFAPDSFFYAFPSLPQYILWCDLFCGGGPAFQHRNPKSCATYRLISRSSVPKSPIGRCAPPLQVTRTLYGKRNTKIETIWVRALCNKATFLRLKCHIASVAQTRKLLSTKYASKFRMHQLHAGGDAPEQEQPCTAPIKTLLQCNSRYILLGVCYRHPNEAHGFSKHLQDNI